MLVYYSTAERGLVRRCCLIFRNGRPGVDEHGQTRIQPPATGPAGGAAAAEGDGHYVAVPDAVNDPNLQHSKETDRNLHIAQCSPAQQPSDTAETTDGTSTFLHVDIPSCVVALLVTAVKLIIFRAKQEWTHLQQLVRTILFLSSLNLPEIAC